MTAHPARTWRWKYGVPIVGLFTIGSAVRALRFGGRFAVRWHWDEAVPAIQAIHVLSGVLPVHFLGIEYIPSLLGAPGSGIRPVITGILPCILVLIVVVGRAVKRDARDLAWALGVRGGPARGGIVLWPVLVANLVLVLPTPRGAESDRYLLPSLVRPAVLGGRLALGAVAGTPPIVTAGNEATAAGPEPGSSE